MNKLNVDCLSIIFCQMDKTSLHSCLLVNREWCRLIVPVLWKKHSWQECCGKRIFNTILSCLPLSLRRLLSYYNTELPSKFFLNRPLFNYISFCRFPEPDIINQMVDFITRNLNNDKRDLIEREIYKLFINRCKNIKKFKWKTLQPLFSFAGASTCFSRLCSLYIDISFVDPNDLYKMAQICKDLNELVIENCYQDFSGLISLIDAQRNLKSVEIHHGTEYRKGACRELGKALARKGDTINYLDLNSISVIPPSFLTSLNNLKKLLIFNHENYRDTSEEMKEFQQYLAISKFPDLQSLIINWLSCFKEFAMLIEKTKGDISDVRIFTHNKAANDDAGRLIKAIANNCPKINTLSTYLEPQDFIHVKLLLNCRHLKLVRFNCLDYFANETDDVGDELLDILTKFSSTSLTYLTISGKWKYSIDSFNRFFESFRERTLSRFDIIQNVTYYITEDHQVIVNKFIKEGVIKESNLEY